MNDTQKEMQPRRRRGAEKNAEESICLRFFSRLLAALRLSGCISIVALAIIAGCIGSPMNPATTQPVTITDTATTQPEYWYADAAAGSCVYDSFATLFKTCENVSRDYCFKIDRVDYREGILTTEPLVSAQIWEPWRPDIQTCKDSRQSTIATVRRTLRFEFKRNADGTFEVSPKVLVERQSVEERRITNVALYHGAFTKEAPRDAPRGTPESDEGFLIPPKFWYAIGRDPVLEVKLAKEVSKRLAKKGRDMSPGTPTTEESP